MTPSVEEAPLFLSHEFCPEMSYLIQGRTIELRSGKKVKFDYPVYEAAEVGGVTIVCLDIPSYRKLNENVYGLDEQGNILWQVKPVAHHYERSRYVGVAKVGELARLFNWDGQVYDVDPWTGNVMSSYWGK
jgi:hypothetical protein